MIVCDHSIQVGIDGTFLCSACGKYHEGRFCVRCGSEIDCREVRVWYDDECRAPIDYSHLVTQERVDNAFEKLARLMKDRPEGEVIVIDSLSMMRENLESTSEPTVYGDNSDPTFVQAVGSYLRRARESH